MLEKAAKLKKKYEQKHRRPHHHHQQHQQQRHAHHPNVHRGRAHIRGGGGRGRANFGGRGRARGPPRGPPRGRIAMRGGRGECVAPRQ